MANCNFILASDALSTTYLGTSLEQQDISVQKMKQAAPVLNSEQRNVTLLLLQKNSEASSGNDGRDLIPEHYDIAKTIVKDEPALVREEGGHNGMRTSAMTTTATTTRIQAATAAAVPVDASSTINDQNLLPKYTPVAPSFVTPPSAPQESPLSPTGSDGSTTNNASKTKPERRGVPHVYHDYSNVPDTIGFVRKKTGGVTQPFPEKLMDLLSKEIETHNYIGWLPHGRAFIIRKPKLFASEVMPKFFRQSKITSFQRQLNLYGFRRITQGPDAGAYYHELFLRGRPQLCMRMNRTKVKGTGHKQPADAQTEPNFYNMPPQPQHPQPPLSPGLAGLHGAATLLKGIAAGLPASTLSSTTWPNVQLTSPALGNTGHHHSGERQQSLMTHHTSSLGPSHEDITTGTAATTAASVFGATAVPHQRTATTVFGTTATTHHQPPAAAAGAAVAGTNESSSWSLAASSRATTLPSVLNSIVTTNCAPQQPQQQQHKHGLQTTTTTTQVQLQAPAPVQSSLTSPHAPATTNDLPVQYVLSAQQQQQQPPPPQQQLLQAVTTSQSTSAVSSSQAANANNVSFSALPPSVPTTTTTASAVSPPQQTATTLLWHLAPTLQNFSSLTTQAPHAVILSQQTPSSQRSAMVSQQAPGSNI